MTVWQWVLGIGIGFGAGVLSGAFGVGGGIITTPAVRLLGGSAIQAIATPLPVIFPTALTGAYTYWRAGEISQRAIKWGIAPGMLGAIVGAFATEIIDARVLLIVTAGLLVIQAVRLARQQPGLKRPPGSTPGWQYAAAGAGAGVVSGLLGIGGGIIYVPIVTTLLGMPIKRALGTSLVLIAAIAIPGTLVHATLGNIDWPVFFALVLGVIPGARIGALLALRAQERSLRLAVAGFLFVVGLGYGLFEIASAMQGRP